MCVCVHVRFVCMCVWVCGCALPRASCIYEKRAEDKKDLEILWKGAKKTKKKSLLRSHLTMKYEGNETLVKRGDVATKWLASKSWQGTLTLILKGEVSVPLTSLYLLVRNQLFQDKLIIFFHFQNNLVPTGKNKEFPFKI